MDVAGKIFFDLQGAPDIYPGLTQTVRLDDCMIHRVIGCPELSRSGNGCFKKISLTVDTKDLPAWRLAKAMHSAMFRRCVAISWVPSVRLMAMLLREPPM